MVEASVVETARRFLRRAERAGILIAVAAAAVTAPFDVHAGIGVALGGVAGLWGIRMLARDFERRRTGPPERLALVMYRGLLLRLAVYGAALLVAYFLDPNGLHGFVGAVAGLFVMRVVLTALGVAAAGGRAPRPPDRSAEDS